MRLKFVLFCQKLMFFFQMLTYNSGVIWLTIIFTNKTKNIFTDGFELTESYNCGSLKCIKLIIKLLSCQSEEKENVFKEINSVDIYYQVMYY